MLDNSSGIVCAVVIEMVGVMLGILGKDKVIASFHTLILISYEKGANAGTSFVPNIQPLFSLLEKRRQSGKKSRCFLSMG